MSVFNSQNVCCRTAKRGFTLIELLIVISIVTFLMASLGVVISNYIENAREAQTIATIQKVEGLISERLKGLERAYRRPDFNVFVNKLQKALLNGDPANGVPQLPGFSREATEMLARKAFARMLFPQYFAEQIPFTTTRIINRLAGDGSWGEDLNANGVLDSGEDTNGNGQIDGVDLSKHTRDTESCELLYYALTKMEVFGVPPIGDEFRTQELKDTDGDGLLEFVDGWGRPLRFYRSPTRLIKPYGVLGPDGVPGFMGDDDTMNGAEDLNEVGFIGSSPGPFMGPSDDLLIDDEWRTFAGLFISGLPKKPIRINQPVLVAYDQLNQDPDDPYGLLLSDFKRLSATGIAITANDLVSTELGASPLWSFPTFDVYHKPLLVSAGADGLLGILEPFPVEPPEDKNGNGILDVGEDFNGNGVLDSFADLNGNGRIDYYGHLALPELNVPAPTPTQAGTASSPVPVAPYILPSAFDAATDNITNRNRRAGGR